MSISDSTLKRAKRKLKVVSDEIRDGKTISGWTWRLPTYTSDPLELLDHVDPLDKGVKEAKSAKKTTHIGETPNLGLIAGGGV